MRMIVLWGNPHEAPMAAVYDALVARGHDDILVIDQNELEDMELEFSVSDRVSGWIKSGGKTYNLAEVCSIYLRPFGWSQADDEKSIYLRQVNEALSCWCEISPALVVNKISSMASNTSKPYQAALIRAHGFKTPDTLITTTPSAVEEFFDLHGDVIYKSISGVRSIVSRLSKQKLANLADIVWSPTQFQQQVPGRDVRVHVVGDRLICSEIITDADDYRYAARSGCELEIRPCEIPDDCQRSCIELVQGLGLAVGGVDLRVTPDGDWFCFEVNPSPGFTFYQNHATQDIAGEIAELLIAGRSDGQRLQRALPGLRISPPAGVSPLPCSHGVADRTAAKEYRPQRFDPAQMNRAG